MAGLVKYYGKDIRNKMIILHLNPLWMSSKKHDLQGDEEFRFNHPELVPQLVPDLACYNPSLQKIVEVAAERSIPFFSWVKHLRIVYFENMNIQEWTIQNPYRSPVSAISLEVPAPENRPKRRPISWQERGIKKQDFLWVETENSFQWRSFKKVIETLKSRNNEVFVLIGPFNTFILTQESFNRYNATKNKVEKWLEANGTSYCTVPDLPSGHYADASHPLKEGYLEIAWQLLKNNSFKEWMKKINGRNNE